MKRRAIVFLGMSALSGAFVAGSSLQGCQSSASGTTGNGGATSASTGTTTTTSTGSSQGGAGGVGGQVPAVVVTIQQLTDANAAGHVGPQTEVEVDGVVVVSHKFLVSQSKATGSCLWGIFVSAPGIMETAPNTGTLVLSYGTPASIADGGVKAYCPVLGQQPAGDAIPDDTALGDVVNVVGKSDYYISKDCGMTPGDASVAQYQISTVSKVTKTGTAALPTPHQLTDAEVTQLASGSDQAFHDQWGGVKVRITNVTSIPQVVDGGAPGITDEFGHIVLAGSGLQVGDSIYYQGLLKFEGDICHSGPVYANDMTTFTQIDGFSYLDFCTWGMLPDNRCVDLVPPSDDCMGNLCP